MKKILSEQQQMMKLNLQLTEDVNLSEAEYLDILISEIDDELEALKDDQDEDEVDEGFGDSVKSAYQGAKSKYHGKQADRQLKKKNDASFNLSRRGSDALRVDKSKEAGKLKKAHSSRAGHQEKQANADRQKEALAKKREQLAKQREKLN